MRNANTTLVAKLIAAGITDAETTMIHGEDGGIICRVRRLADIETAERVAADVQSLFGWEVLVAF